MSITIETIPFLNLALAFIPAFVAIGILYKWSISAGNALYAMARMLVQLLLIGYFLAYIFGASNSLIVVIVLIVMVFSASWISLRTLSEQRWSLFKYALAAILLAGGSTLILVTQGVLNLEPWYKPQFMVPLAGMIFANAMNSISLAGDRLQAELERGSSYKDARNIALHTSNIPLMNMLFAVGLVSLPGMMTGQILSGVSPLIAVRYQILVMCMVFGSSVIAVACFLVWARPVFEKKQANNSLEN